MMMIVAAEKNYEVSEANHKPTTSQHGYKTQQLRDWRSTRSGNSISAVEMMEVVVSEWMEEEICGGVRYWN